ncbi:helix-turn-helix domain-containing protein [Paenibacillus thermotolerans]|uniref:helix-turn-helix domain-containing protein n=1 Tax=Paenibacillus thermotolerans TaxID=3027807 RepID=UPI0023681A92|nr:MULTISPECIES: helix-turn-helix domain-containing protein [unclassified Paenibacillus]
MNNTWFRRLLISYLPVFIIVVTILFILFFQVFNEQNRKQALQANEFMASQVLQYTDNSLRAIDYKVLREILTNQKLKEYFNKSDSKDVYSIIQAVEVMDDLKLEYPLIQSIYYVRFSDGTVLSNGKAVPIGEFPDAAFIEKHRSNTGQKWSEAREFKSIDSEQPQQVVTLVRGVSNYEQGLVVVNVDINSDKISLQGAINRMFDPNISFVRIEDLAGHDLLSSKPSAGESQGPGDSSQVFSEFTSGYTGWKVQTGMRNGLVGFALDLYNVWFAFAVAVVLVGGAWVFYVTRRNYKPIQQIVAFIESFAFQKNSVSGHSGQNEFNFIHTTLESMIEQSKQYQRQYADNLILHKKYFFHELLEGARSMEEDEWKSEMGKLNIPAEGKRWAVLIVEIDRYRKFTEEFNRQDQSLLKFVLSSVLQETVQEEGTHAWVEWTSDRRLSCMLWLPDSVQQEAWIHHVLSTFLDWVKNNVRFTVTVGIGRAASDLRGLRESRKDAAHALQFKAVLGDNRVIHVKDVPIGKNDVYEHLKSISMFVRAIRLTEEEWRSHLDLLFDQIAEAMLSREEIVNLIQFTIQHCEREFSSLPREYQERWAESLGMLLQGLDEWETLDDLKRSCSVAFQELASQIQTIRHALGHRSLILQIRKYIEENYGNPDLSLNFLSDVFEINGKYLSKLFKEEFGENFLDFLIGHRIMNAKRLMLETGKPIQEISEEVGYTNYISFNRAFKNVEGVSPSDFRKKYSDASEANIQSAASNPQ